MPMTSYKDYTTASQCQLQHCYLMNELFFYFNCILADLVKHLSVQSILTVPARLVFGRWCDNHATSLLRPHWLLLPQCTAIEHCLLGSKPLNGLNSYYNIFPDTVLAPPLTIVIHIFIIHQKTFRFFTSLQNCEIRRTFFHIQRSKPLKSSCQRI